MKNYLLLFAALFFLFPACKKNCESLKVGEQALDEESKKYAPYTDAEVLVFTNIDGENLSFVVERQEASTDRMCTKYLCENISDPFQQIPCEYYEGESIRNVLRAQENDTLLIDILVSINNYEEESFLFYDMLSISFSGISNLARGEGVLHSHFTEPEIEPEKLNFSDPFIDVASIEINGETYTDVLQTAEGETVIYYTKSRGIIGLKLNNVLFF